MTHSSLLICEEYDLTVTLSLLVGELSGRDAGPCWVCEFGHIVLLDHSMTVNLLLLVSVSGCEL
jgi:hypothetical protein